MDRRLRRVSDKTWEGELRGYRVQVFQAGGGWCVSFVSPRGHTEAVLVVANVMDERGGHGRGMTSDS
jgi:hypothetical protein